jgi:hypothetical protein
MLHQVLKILDFNKKVFCIFMFEDIWKVIEELENSLNIRKK